MSKSELLLRHGDRLKQPEFHRRYLACPDNERFELVGGVVYRTPRVTRDHSLYHSELSFALGSYRRAPPEIEAGIRATVILGEESEPQPDILVRVPTEFGGRSCISGEDFVEGPPEMLAEIAYSSRDIDLQQKREDYERAGVQEYLVLCIEEQTLHWFDFAGKKMIGVNRQGVYRSRIFPGLWLHAEALLSLDSGRVLKVLQQGIASREHAAFVRRLERARREHG